MSFDTCDTVAVECNEGAGLEEESCTVFCKNLVAFATTILQHWYKNLASEHTCNLTSIVELQIAATALPWLLLHHSTHSLGG